MAIPTIATSEKIGQVTSDDSTEATQMQASAFSWSAIVAGVVRLLPRYPLSLLC